MLTTERTADTLVVRPQGRITAVNANEFRAELLARIEQGEKNLTIDLAGVDMIDSKGLAVFIACHLTLDSQGGTLTVVSDNEDFRHLFHVMRLDERFIVRGSE